MKLPACHSRRELEPGGKVFFCAHPNVHALQQKVTAEICKACTRWRDPPPKTFRDPDTSEPQRGPCFYLGDQTGLRACDTCRGKVQLKVFACEHPLHHETTRDECQKCVDHEPRLATGAVKTWAVGITTAPRERPTLERTVRSLASAGWKLPRIFAEPGVELPDNCEHLPLTRRDAPLGGWPNWLLALGELVLREPQADAYFLVQDDVAFCRNIRAYLERTLWPSGKVGLVSVYCPAVYVRRVRGLHCVDAGWSLISALTCVFPNAAARSLLGHARVLSHRRSGPYGGVKSIDAVIGRWAKDCGLPAYFHTPSLAQHTGDTSTVWPTATNEGQRHASDFVGEDFDAAHFALENTSVASSEP